MRQFLTIAAAAATLAVAAAPAQAAILFTGDHSVTVNQAEPGLVVRTQEIASTLNFSLDLNQTTTVDLFKLYTLETSVNPDDLSQKAISVGFTFTVPEVFGGAVGGTTVGQYFFGIFDKGVVTWNNGGTHTFDFGNGGKLMVDLDNADFNGGFVDLNPGKAHGAKIKADFTLTQLPSAVPEPATWAMMITGFGLAGTALRRRRATAVFA
ncbi:PEPxxWA-CTERM sorting domain-containing protein [Phenylobacterium sp.]|uniref:PEPxxWA-CTERM sorting domain-containing protein n=1 Tax=Phenylobacterium sp. TaxID=1871053 RepID=UPI00286BF88D|nr:PEPxxWA-CTERM sorting domain-containing protein [Phenylobacterium sp.]